MHVAVRSRDRIDAIAELSYQSLRLVSSTRTAVRVATVVSARACYLRASPCGIAVSVVKPNSEAWCYEG